MKYFVLTCLLVPTLIGANHCQELDMTITNNTGHICRLALAKIEQGHISENSQVADIIPNNTESASLIIKQTALHGPKVKLSYTCEGKSITLESDQSLCVMVEGTVHTDIEAADNMGAQAKTQKGSFIWNKHGEVRWRLH